MFLLDISKSMHSLCIYISVDDLLKIHLNLNLIKYKVY